MLNHFIQMNKRTKLLKNCFRWYVVERNVSVTLFSAIYLMFLIYAKNAHLRCVWCFIDRYIIWLRIVFAMRLTCVAGFWLWY